MMTQSTDHVGELLSGYLDGELTQQQSQLVRLHCETCGECSAELDELTALRERVGAAALAPLDQTVWSERVNDATDRATRGLGWIFLVVGVVGVCGWGVYEFVIDSSLSLTYKLLIGCGYLGLSLLFVSVLRQRLMEQKTDKYKKVEI